MVEQPPIDLVFLEPPAPAYAHRGKVAALDQPVNGHRVDPEISGHFLDGHDRRSSIHGQASGARVHRGYLPKK